MKKLRIKDLLKVTNGKMIIGNKETECENFCKDTRMIQEKDTYIGIKGESFNGNFFWKEALEKGASTVLVEGINFSEEDLESFAGKNIILVKDTVKALQEIATYKRTLYDIPVVGITGSVGKTSTKDMIASVLSQKYETLRTIGNNNNHIGLPFTILNLREHEAAVIEMGMNHAGEISVLTNIAKPTLSVITNIGTSHIGNLGSRENILKAKLEILEGMEFSKIIINNDNDLLHEWEKQNQDKVAIKTYGIENCSEIMAKEIVLREKESSFICTYQKEEFEVKVPVAGIHFVYNALCAIMVGLQFKLTIPAIQKGIETFELTKKRMDMMVLNNGAKVINDAYNASFESMQASLKILGEYKNNRKIAVLGDMLELGEFSKKLHEKVGEEVVRNKIDLLLCQGNLAIDIVKQAERTGMNCDSIYYFETKEEMAEFMKEMIKPEDVILLKASNGMKFYELIEKIQ